MTNAMKIMAVTTRDARLPAPTAIGLVVNGAALASAADCLGALLAELGYGDAKVATAVNGVFVPAARRGATRLSAGDKIEIVAPRQGG